MEWTVESRYRPFCSQRCKVVDLGAWASEEYVMPSEEEEPLSEDVQRI
ncbi:hypothetical protein l11_00900 [Neisseria weaveri LMG 5135]|nr:hypothetical protein l13_06710 [Neisseria weaveri ATCC 51223]EGV38643.1 hypothetical protein l11_00900 [Neisseria weaveri LMG 5135]